MEITLEGNSAETSNLTQPTQLQTAVLLITFRRQAHTREVLEAIRTARPTRLYFASDGAREGNEGERELVSGVRSLISEVDWPCEVHTLFQDTNLGCGSGVKAAIDWFFSNEESGIILEDDTVPNFSFFLFCQELLSRYETDTRVGLISGTNHVASVSSDSSYFFSKNKKTWGWATWKRAWDLMDFSMAWRTGVQANSVRMNMGVSK